MQQIEKMTIIQPMDCFFTSCSYNQGEAIAVVPILD